MTEAEFRQLLDAGLDKWEALKQAGYETHARNVYRLRRYAIENPPSADDSETPEECACGCGRRLVQATRGRPRRFYGDHRHRARNERNGTLSV